MRQVIKIIYYISFILLGISGYLSFVDKYPEISMWLFIISLSIILYIKSNRNDWLHIFIKKINYKFYSIIGRIISIIIIRY